MTSRQAQGRSYRPPAVLRGDCCVSSTDNLATTAAYLILLDEADESGPLDFDGLTGTIVQGDHEVEEVRLSQIAWRLLLKVCPSNAQAVSARERERAKRERDVN